MYRPRPVVGVALVAIILTIGCDSASTPASPTAVTQSPAPLVLPQPASTVSGISGFVLDTGFRSLAGATVEVIDGAHAGTSTTSGPTGEFSFSGTFDHTTQFRASKEGHVTATQTWSCSVQSCPGPTGARPWVGFYLAVAAPLVDIAGKYTLTFVADSACADLPSDVRSRTYDTTITGASRPNIPANTWFDLVVDGAPFLTGFNGFLIGVAGDYLGFWLHGGHDPPIVEQLSPTTYLAFSGNARASSGSTGASTISAPFEGWIEYCELKGPMTTPPYNCGTSPRTGEPIPGAAVVYTHCESTNHRLTLMRR